MSTKLDLTILSEAIEAAASSHAARQAVDAADKEMQETFKSVKGSEAAVLDIVKQAKTKKDDAAALEHIEQAIEKHGNLKDTGITEHVKAAYSSSREAETHEKALKAAQGKLRGAAGGKFGKAELDVAKDGKLKLTVNGRDAYLNAASLEDTDKLANSWKKNLKLEGIEFDNVEAAKEAAGKAVAKTAAAGGKIELDVQALRDAQGAAKGRTEAAKALEDATKKLTDAKVNGLDGHLKQMRGLKDEAAVTKYLEGKPALKDHAADLKSWHSAHLKDAEALETQTKVVKEAEGKLKGVKLAVGEKGALEATMGGKKVLLDEQGLRKGAAPLKDAIEKAGMKIEKTTKAGFWKEFGANRKTSWSKEGSGAAGKFGKVLGTGAGALIVFDGAKRTIHAFVPAKDEKGEAQGGGVGTFVAGVGETAVGLFALHKSLTGHTKGAPSLGFK